MRKWPRLVVVLVGILLACGAENRLTTGTVADKEYDDPDEWTTLECAGYDQNGYCRMHYTAYHRDGEHFKIQVEGKDDKGDDRTEWHTVDSETYYAYDIGDIWVKGSLPCTEQCWVTRSTS